MHSEPAIEKPRQSCAVAAANAATGPPKAPCSLTTPGAAPRPLRRIGILLGVRLPRVRGRAGHGLHGHRRTSISRLLRALRRRPGRARRRPAAGVTGGLAARRAAQRHPAPAPPPVSRPRPRPVLRGRRLTGDGHLMTTTTPSRGRRRAPTRMERAAGKAAALQKPRVILALLLLLALTSVMLLDGYLRAEVGGDQRVRDGASSSNVPDKILNGGPIVTFRGGQATTTVRPGQDDRADLRRRPEPDVHAPGPGDPGEVRRPRHVLRGRLDGLALPGRSWRTWSSRATRWASTPSPTSTSPTRATPASSGRWSRRSWRSRARPASRPRCSGRRTPRRRTPSTTTAGPSTRQLGAGRLHQRLRRHRQRRLEEARRLEDRQVGHAAKSKGASVLIHDAGGDRDADDEGAARVHREDEGEGLHLHHRQRGHRGAATRAQGRTRANVPAGAAGGAAPGGTRTAADRLQAAHREATGATLYEGKALVAAVAVAEWMVPALSVGLMVVGVAVMGRFGMMLILARRHHRQRNRRRLQLGARRSPGR